MTNAVKHIRKILLLLFMCGFIVLNPAIWHFCSHLLTCTGTHTHMKIIQLNRSDPISCWTELSPWIVFECVKCLFKCHKESDIDKPLRPICLLISVQLAVLLNSLTCAGGTRRLARMHSGVHNNGNERRTYSESSENVSRESFKILNALKP